MEVVFHALLLAVMLEDALIAQKDIQLMIKKNTNSALDVCLDIVFINKLLQFSILLLDNVFNAAIIAPSVTTMLRKETQLKPLVLLVGKVIISSGKIHKTVGHVP